MSFKTFTVKNMSQGWDADEGYQITIYGKFYDATAKSLKNKTFLVIGEGPTCRMTAWDDYMYVQTDKTTLDSIFAKFKDKNAYERLEVFLEGTGTKNLRVAYFNSHAI